MSHWPGAKPLSTADVDPKQAAHVWIYEQRAQTHLRECVCVILYACMPACLHIYWYGQRQTESDHLWALIWPPISSLARSGTMMGRPLCPCAPALPRHPRRLPLTSSPRTDPLSVRCTQDQQPRQCPFHHSGPQCLFHKLSQALGLKRCIAVGFRLYKHTNSRGWQVEAQNPMPLPSPHPIFFSFNPTVNWRYGASTMCTNISEGPKSSSSFSASSHIAYIGCMHTMTLTQQTAVSDSQKRVWLMCGLKEGTGWWLAA